MSVAENRQKLSFVKGLVPASLRGYKRSWLVTDVVAGATLAAVAIPETMDTPPSRRPQW